MPAPLALAAYEWINDAVTGTSGREARSSVAAREAKSDWEAKAKAKHGADFGWMTAYKVGNLPSYRMNGAFYIGTATAYPCRLKAADSLGQVLHAETEAERACQDRPGFETAQKYGCKLFYLRGNQAMRGLLAALLLLSLSAPPGKARAQDYVEAVCGDHIQVTGAAAQRDRKAQENAIAAYNDAPRAKYRQKTGFTFEAGERMGQVKLVCQGAGGGRTACLASGRACVWRPTTVPNTSVMAQCEEGYLLFATGGKSSCTRRFIDDIVLNFKPLCPKGYSLEPNPGRVPRCLRD